MSPKNRSARKRDRVDGTAVAKNQQQVQDKGMRWLYGLIVVILGAATYLLTQFNGIFELLDKLCERPSFTRTCETLNFRSEKVEKLILLLQGQESSTRIHTLNRISKRVMSSPVDALDASEPFAIYLNERFRKDKGAERLKEDDPAFRKSFEILSLIAMAHKTAGTRQKFELVDLDLRKNDLSGLDLNGITFKRIWMHDSNLENSDFGMSRILESRMDRVRGSNANFSHAVLDKTCLEGAILKHANFSAATLTNLDLNTADLTKAIFKEARLDKVRLGQRGAADVSIFESSSPSEISGIFSEDLKSEITVLQSGNSYSRYALWAGNRKFNQCSQ